MREAQQGLHRPCVAVGAQHEGPSTPPECVKRMIFEFLGRNPVHSTGTVNEHKTTGTARQGTVPLVPARALDAMRGCAQLDTAVEYYV